MHGRHCKNVSTFAVGSVQESGEGCWQLLVPASTILHRSKQSLLLIQGDQAVSPETGNINRIGLVSLMMLRKVCVFTPY